MQSGLSRRKFLLKRSHGVTYIHVDPYNKYLLALTKTSYLVLYDFYTTKVL